MWLRQAIVAESELNKMPEQDKSHFYQGKIQAAQYFIRWELPKIDLDAALLKDLDDTCLNMQPNWF
jgi:hypothetical protein